MQISLGHFLFSVLLGTGVAFSCKSCRQEPTSCTPISTTCSASEEHCVTTVETGNLDNSPFVIVERNCTTLEICKAPFIHLTFGAGRYITKISECCHTDSCDPPYPKVPQSNSTRNGRSCPTCYSLTGDCDKDEILDCTGFDTFCFSFTVTSDKKTKNGQIKGCTTETTCTALKTYKGPVVGLSFVEDVTCQKSKGTRFALEFHFLSLLLMTLFLLSLH